VVSFAHAAIPEVVSHGRTGLLAPEREILPLVQYLTNLLKQDDLWNSMSRHAVTWVRDQFDLNRQSEKLEELYDACCLV
jgi:colanic acid/amylovoran biosynthesis glycosyltransferase